MKKQNNILRAIFTVLAIIILVNAGSAFAASAKNSRIASGAPTVKTRTVQPAEANSSEVTASKASGSKASKKSSAKTVEARTAKNTIKATGKAVKTAKTDDSVSASKVSASKTAKASGKTTKTTKTAAKATKTTKPPTLKIDSNTSGMSSEEAKIYKTLKAQMKKMPEGMPWSNANSYQFRGGIFGTGYGCSGFAFKMSDTVFGDKPAKLHTNYNNIRVGDIIRMNGNTHSVIVLKVVGDTFVVAEGNYNASIHWGRLIKRSEVKATGTYVMSRY